MKIFTLRNWLAVTLSTISSLSMADIWQPTTSGDSTFFTLDALLNIPSADTFGIFAANASVGSSTPALIFTGADTVAFYQIGANYQISDSVASGTLWNSNNFQIGWLDTAGVWITESGSSQLSLIGPNSYNLAFIDPSSKTADNLHTLYAFDVTRAGTSISDFITSVPLPGAAWMMFSALTAMIFTARHKLSISA
jgi:hypothetical protein